MKVYAVCFLVAGGVFFAGLLQLGALKNGWPKNGLTDSAKEEKKAPRKAVFPIDLAPAAQAKPVETAAPFKPSPAVHKLVFMTPRGEIHPWHDGLPTEWQAETVEETELVVVIGKEKSRLVQVVHCDRGNPIDRMQFDLEVSVVEAKTGNILDNRIFRNAPRQCRRTESYVITVIGRSVEWSTVFHWVTEHSKKGFPEDDNGLPVVTEVE